MIVSNEGYRLNPNRAIFVSGTINPEMVARLTPQILKLQSLNRKPITVYVDSPGGQVNSMETILRLLKLPDQDSMFPCRIITTVTTRAASAAADMLSSGDYAVAYPNSTLLYHGVRQQEISPLTVEMTSMLANVLRLSNDQYALELARKIEHRFVFRYVMAYGEFAAIREELKEPEAADLDCFSRYIESKLSASGKQVWQKVKDRHSRYIDLIVNVLTKVKADPAKVPVNRLDADTIKRIVDFELKRNSKISKWSFRNEGISQLADDFFLFDELISSYGRDRIERWCKRWGKNLLSKEQMDAIDTIGNEKGKTAELVTKARPLLQPVLSFFVAFCHALQEGENQLSAVDAYWLGLVDEVVGEDLISLRSFVEYRPDPIAEENKNSDNENSEKQ